MCGKQCRIFFPNASISRQKYDEVTGIITQRTGAGKAEHKRNKDEFQIGNCATGISGEAQAGQRRPPLRWRSDSVFLSVCSVYGACAWRRRGAPPLV